MACLALGMAEYQAMDMSAAARTLAEAVRVGERTDMPIPALVALGHLADIALADGRLDEARALVARGMRHADAESHTHFPHAACVHAAHAGLLSAEHDHAAARAEADRAVALARRGSMAVRSHAMLVRGGCTRPVSTTWRRSTCRRPCRADRGGLRPAPAAAHGPPHPQPRAGHRGGAPRWTSGGGRP